MSENIDPAMQGRLDKAFDDVIKAYLREKERNNDDRIYVHLDSSDWYRIYGNSAFFYRFLSDEVIDRIRDSNVSPTSAHLKSSGHKTPPKKSVRLLPDTDGKVRFTKRVSIKKLDDFFWRLQGVQYIEKPEEVPSKFRGRLLVFKLPNAFTPEQISAMKNADKIIYEHETDIVFGNIPNRDILTLSRKTLRSTYYATWNGKANVSPIVKETLVSMMRLRSAVLRWSKYSANKEGEVRLLKQILNGCENTLAGLDCCIDTSEVELSRGDDICTDLAALMELVSKRLLKIDIKFADSMVKYNKLREKVNGGNAKTHSKNLSEDNGDFGTETQGNSSVDTWREVGDSLENYPEEDYYDGLGVFDDPLFEDGTEPEDFGRIS